MPVHHCNLQGGHKKGASPGGWQSLTVSMIQPYNFSCSKTVLKGFCPSPFTSSNFLCERTWIKLSPPKIHFFFWISFFKISNSIDWIGSMISLVILMKGVNSSLIVETSNLGKGGVGIMIYLEEMSMVWSLRCMYSSYGTVWRMGSLKQPLDLLVNHVSV